MYVVCLGLPGVCSFSSLHFLFLRSGSWKSGAAPMPIRIGFLLCFFFFPPGWPLNAGGVFFVLLLAGWASLAHVSALGAAARYQPKKKKKNQPGSLQLLCEYARKPKEEEKKQQPKRNKPRAQTKQTAVKLGTQTQKKNSKKNAREKKPAPPPHTNSKVDASTTKDKWAEVGGDI